MTTQWLSPEQLAAEMGKPVRWVRDHMASGDIPSVKVGNSRFFTPACREELERRALGAHEADEGWSQITRGKAS